SLSTLPSRQAPSFPTRRSSDLRQDVLTEKADQILTSKVWSIPVFFGIMAVILFLTFTLGDWLKGYLELAIGAISDGALAGLTARSEEHTSELQSRFDLVCRLLL